MPETPTFRATLLRDSSLRVIDWSPWLVTHGPMVTLLDSRRRAGVALADLSVIRDDASDAAAELVVEFRSPPTRAHRRALLEWAARVGYRRVWLPDELVELDPEPGGSVETRCTGCAVRLVDSDASFWEFVRRRGAFPSACVLCGSDLPQWTRTRRRGRHAGGGGSASSPADRETGAPRPR